jgi:hypothetical protein
LPNEVREKELTLKLAGSVKQSVLAMPTFFRHKEKPFLDQVAKELTRRIARGIAEEEANAQASPGS